MIRAAKPLQAAVQDTPIDYHCIPNWNYAIGSSSGMNLYSPQFSICHIPMVSNFYYFFDKIFNFIKILQFKIKICSYCLAIEKYPFDHTNKECVELARLRPCRLCGASGIDNHTISLVH